MTADQAKALYPTTEEMNTAIGVMRSMISAPADNHTFTVPQVIVIYRDRKRAYGRALLKSLGCRALYMLREQFGLRNGITPEPTWEKKALATFVRTHGHNDRDAVILDEGSWDELIDNVAKIELDPHFAFGSISLNLKTLGIIVVLLVVLVRFLIWLGL